VKIVVGGTPSSGKSRVVLALARAGGFGRLGVAKLDCVTTTDDALFAARGLPVTRLLAGRHCPDHLLMERLAELDGWASAQGLDTLAIETAGLCGRCAPYLADAVAVCVVDCTAGVRAPRKLGPLLADADVVVLSKGDLVSQAEREVFAAAVAERNPGAARAAFDGLTGEGGWELARAVRERAAGVAAAADGASLRTALPQLYCSYCLGRSEAGIRTM
jgi:Ni2+-binding GTPase involved in maturation of urease and hydrogenase